jgi:hypothetical protein
MSVVLRADWMAASRDGCSADSWAVPKVGRLVEYWAASKACWWAAAKVYSMADPKESSWAEHWAAWRAKQLADLTAAEKVGLRVAARACSMVAMWAIRWAGWRAASKADWWALPWERGPE